MDITSPWHWDCAECGGPIARLCLSGPCVEIHRFEDEHGGKPVPCGLEMNISQAELKRLGVADHDWNGGWVHTDPRGLCVCHHPKHGEDCYFCWDEVGRVLGGWHAYTPYEQIEKDHEPAYRAAVPIGV